MMKVYLDYNIYLRATESNAVKKILYWLRKERIQIFCSPAHMEEVYKGGKDGAELEKVKRKSRIDLIQYITNGKILLPSDQGIIEKVENLYDTYNRVKKYDTKKYVEKNADNQLANSKKHYESLLEKDKNIVNIKEKTFEEIWNDKNIQEALKEVNDDIENEIEAYNRLIDITNARFSVNKRKIRREFCICPDMYKKIKFNHTELEYTIEILFHILNNCGYWRERKKQTSISGTHDISHSIYATKVDYLVTTDVNFYNKCKAVYAYLGVKTKVVLLKQEDLCNEIKTTILDMYNDYKL